MANLTVREAIDIKGTDPQHLVEKIVRTRIYEARYWKEECFALTAELLVDKAIELKSIGGIYSGNIKPTPFLCLVLKMLQIQPEKDIIVEFIKNEEFKYVRALGAFYMRITGSSQDVYKYLEPLYIDYRKMKRLNKDSKYELVYMDEFIDELLHSDRVCDITLPRLQKRSVLEELNELEVKVSPLEVNLDEIESSEEEEEDEESASKSEKTDSDEELKKKLKKEKKKRRQKSRSRSRSRKRDKKRSKTKSRSKSRSSSRNKYKKSSRSSRYVDFDDPNEDESADRTRRSRSRDNHKKRYDSRERDRRRSKSREKRSRK
ncbi:pre-mRNA-splicing factor 38A [Brachionus plicatilis]|uniref:Pre-mRNA-splicing factor 38 n=1 Tax=Brachionus plicatilis TaxID=10195 RepID=A0A3M7Q584_BRAPC|nr:pre-mRNA-splicing factor 38A [Brachionus plicatilis]